MKLLATPNSKLYTLNSKPVVKPLIFAHLNTE